MNTLLPTLPPGIRSLTDAEGRDLDQRHPEAAITVANCITCGGSRTFRWYAPGTREIVDYVCDCREQYLLSRYLWHCGVLPKFQRLGWRDVLSLDFAGGEIYADYLANSAEYVRRGYGLVLHGPRGTGKTLIAHLVLKDLIAQGLDCYVTTFEKMVDAYTGGWDSKEQERWFNARLSGTKVLLIDDLGREHKRGNWSVAEDMLESVIRHRVACEMPTLFTTNLNPKENLEAAYGGHTISLLNECSMLCEVDGQDSRIAMNARGVDEVRARIVRPIVIG